MKKAKPNRVIPKKITRLKKEKSEIERLNEEALKRIRAFKGSFG
ncbi:hypothetical protein [Neobacillus piezotolerans]|nr:hypothetical protein [Neobacillus piezotolerans]